MKPNGEELASFTGARRRRPRVRPRAAAEAARSLVDRGVGAVLATLGAHGAVLVNRDGAWHATPPPTTVVSTVGAGDSSLFGYLLGDLRRHGPAERLALAVAYGSAAAGLPGTTIPNPVAGPARAGLGPAARQHRRRVTPMTDLITPTWSASTPTSAPTSTT